MNFEWNPDKAAVNLRKHKVSFEEAQTVFGDEWSMDAPDPDHSLEEERFIIVGHSTQGKILLVSYTERNDRIRIISARMLTKSERQEYEEGI